MSLEFNKISIFQIIIPKNFKISQLKIYQIINNILNINKK